MTRLARLLGHQRLGVRLAAAYALFFALLVGSYTLGLFLLPEGALSDLPLPSLALLGESGSPWLLAAKTLGYNLFLFLLILGANHYRVGRFTLGYLPLYVNVILLGLFAGTNSFAGDVSSHSPAGWLLFLRIGFLEFSAYILACVATVPLAMFHADRWRGESFHRIRRFRDVRLSRPEWACLLLALGLLIMAAVNEWILFGPQAVIPFARA